MKSLPIDSKPTPRLLNIRDTARYLGTTIWRVRKLGWAKQLPYITLSAGGRWLFDQADVDRLIEKLKLQHVAVRER